MCVLASVLLFIAYVSQNHVPDRHIVEKRGAYDRGGFSSGPCCMYGPMLSYNRGIVAALPKFIKAKFLEEKARRYMPCDMLCFRINVQILQVCLTHRCSTIIAPQIHLREGHCVTCLVSRRGLQTGFLASCLLKPPSL